MSMKRTKQVSRVPRYRDGEGGGFNNTPKPEGKAYSWEEHVAGQPDDVFAAYQMGTTFQIDALLVHPKFGKGIVTRVDGRRIEVLFQEGAKKLGHAG